MWNLWSYPNLPHSWEGDVREPLFTFSWTKGGDPYGFFVNDIFQNVEVAFVLWATALLSALVACILYTTIIAKNNVGTISAYLLGYGLIIPFWIWSPMFLIRSFSITNKIFRFVISTIPTLSLLRTMEAIHGFCPPYATKSMGDFALYYASLFIVRYDKKEHKYVKATYKTVFQKLFLYTRGVLLIGALHSLYLQFPDTFIEFGTSFDRNDWYSFDAIFQWRRLWDNLCFAFFFQAYLSTCAFGLQLTTILGTGLQIEEMWVDPLSKSGSFSDFWSERWNRSVHIALKRGVFMPMRKYFPKYVAMASTFLASGLFHEWLVWITFSPLPPWNVVPEDDLGCVNANCYRPTYGSALVFFLFQALLIAFEYWIGNEFKTFTSALPSPLVTLLVVCIGGSMAHWFSDGYVHSSFFLDSRVAYVLVRRLD